MLIFNEIKLRNYFICIILSLKLVLSDLFVDIKKLNLYDSYFVVLNSGLYLYNFNTMDCSIILEFNSTVYKSSDNKINLTELYDDQNSFIFCLVNEYLFIFNEKNNETYSYKIDDITDIMNIGGYYNLMPYKYENNNISFIIAYNQMSAFLYFFYYNFPLNDSINEPKEKMIVFSIEDNMIRCQIIPKISSIKCFYYYNNTQNYLKSVEFLIKEKEMTITQNTENSYEVNNIINQIKLTKAYNNNLFICILINNTPKCYINIDSKNELKEIDCEHTNYWLSTYKVLYFNTTGEFLFASGMHLTTTILNNYNFSVSICQEDIFCDQNTSNSIIYNNGYKFVNDYNFTNYKTCTNISIRKEEEIKSPRSSDIYNIPNISDKYYEYLQVFKIINELNIYDLNKTQEMIFTFDDKIITFTSTYMQNINQNKNITTINLGKCEIELKNRYNISNESDLYILKIESEKKGMNFPIVEYEVYNPLKNETLKKLNLSFCEGIKIEISYPFNLNDDIDKYDPNSNYYNDICSKTKSENGTDIILTDRRNEFIENNMSLCDNNCLFIEYDNINKKVKCSCNVKPLLSFDFIELDKDILMKNFLDINKITNIAITKCYKIVFNKKNIISNYGSFILITIFILFIICLIIFYSKSLNSLIKEINEIIKAKKYIKKNKANKNKNNNNNQPRNIFINNINNNKKNKIKKKSKTKKKGADSSSRRKVIQENIIETNNKKVKKGNKNKKKRIEQNLGNINNIIDKKITGKNKRILEYNQSELNSLSYKKALNKDKRSYGQYYFSLLKEKQLLIFSFYPNKDYNSRIIKIFLFFYFFSSNLTINALFFTDDTMHKIYINSGSFNLYYQLPQFIYSSLISGIINKFIKFLSLSSKTITEIKAKKKNKKENWDKIKVKHMKIKFGFFFVTSFILLWGFWYYISCFCAVYENTQILLIKDSLISFGLSLIYPIFINLIPGLFRISALKAKKGDKECLYKFSNILAIF